MPVVTALRERPRARIAVELDGSPWRELPADVVARAGLGVGKALDRETARAVRRALRRFEALEVAARSLRTRDFSAGELGMRLRRASVAPAVQTEVVARMQGAGLVDDERYAERRAAGLAERGYGDAAIDADLERRGVPGDLRAGALGRLEPEPERARAVWERRGPGPRTARYLAARGFAPEAVEAAAGAAFAPDP